MPLASLFAITTGKICAIDVVPPPSEGESTQTQGSERFRSPEVSHHQLHASMEEDSLQKVMGIDSRFFFQ